MSDGDAVERGHWETRPARTADRGRWEALYADYCEFYEVPTSAQHRARVWDWIEEGALAALVCVPAGDAGPAVGLAHVRPFIRPIRGTVGGFLDDLFIAPEARGSGAFEALMAALRERAREEGWDTVRWMTSESNARARAAYEREATRTQWLIYEMEP